MTVEFKLDDRQVPDGTVFLVGVAFDRIPDKTWTYSLIKAGGRWYTSGTGKSPQDAGWGAVNRWLNREGTQVVYIDAVTGRDRLWASEGVTAEGKRRHLSIVRSSDEDYDEDPLPPWAEKLLDIDVPLHDGPDTYGVAR
jgi:hypothetical protein